jgi:Tol biopolymer transport system component
MQVTRRTLRILVPTLLALLVLASSAQAAFPGDNGRLALTGYEQKFGIFFNPAIFTVNLDGSDVMLLATSSITGEPTTPSWSPDGLKIAFDRGFVYRDIYKMNADGTGVTQLTSGSVNADPTWSPDGTKIVFSRATSPGGVQDVYTMNADGTAVTKLTDGGSQPVWSPSGDQIAFTSGGQIHLIAPDGTGRQALTPGSFPDWSPDGRRIVFELAGEIHASNADGTGLVQLTNESPPDPTTISNQNPAWSPDGTQVAFAQVVCNYEVGPDFCHHSLATINTDGSGGRTTHPLGGLEPDWQPLPPPEPRRSDYKNAAQFCKALREFLGDADFRARYGGGANAYGKCVSSKRK